MPEIITENLDLWSSALLTKSTAGRGSNGKLEAYGIKKLRELILELAVRGRLVPQDANDEPASVLLEKIAKEKERLIKEGKIKKEKPLPEITEEEKGYELPAGWIFVRLGNVALSQAGFAFKSNFFNENSDGLPLIRIRDVGQPFTGTFYSGEYREEFLVEKGDYLISMDGEFRVSPWTNGSALLNQRVSRLIFYYENVGQRFIADSLQARLRELQGVKAYTTVDHLSGAQITEAVIGLPPLTEQHRIVAKVDELMALCDQLEQQQTHSIEAHQTLVASLLGTLTRVETRQEFIAAWARIADHFDTLFTTEASIDQLKQTILQLAVMGKLVPQDTNDEPASALVEKIAKAKGKLVEEGVIRKQDKLPEIEEVEMPFELPSGWSFVRLGNLSKVITKGSSPKWQGVSYTDNPDDVLFVTSENVGSYTLLLDSKKYVEKNFNEVEPRSILKKGDFLMNIVGASIGRTAIYDIDVIANINQAVCLIRAFSEFLDSKFLLHFFNSAICVSYMFDKQVDNARANLSMGNIARFVMPLPPVEEQHRIVAKVDELLALCDALKARIADAQALQLYLADAIVEQAVC